jgi:transcription antitermination factor NusG
MTSPAWYVFYCASRAEKKAAESLRKLGYEVFLPLQTTVRQWSDRKKKVSEPLFKGYLFVHCSPHQFSVICSVQGVVAPVKIGTEWGQLRDEDQQAIQRFVEEGIFAETVSEVFAPGDKVKITQGIFKGLEGHIAQFTGDTFFYLTLDTLQLSVKVKLPGEYLHKL